MAIQKLSQITAAAGPPGPSDTLVGVSAGNVDQRYSLAQVSTYQGWINLKDLGAVADGSSHPLSTRYGTLAAAQVVYPFATSLTQELDYCAAQLASNIAFGSPPNAGNTQLNSRVRINAGIYFFGNDTWKITKLHSGVIEGDGKLVSVLTGNNIILQTDGCWYSVFGQFTVQALTPVAAAFDLDGNVSGTGATNGVQGNTFYNLLIIGGGSTYAFAMCRQGTNAAQGSENQFIDCHFQSGATACYYQAGFNAIANILVGGDMQGYSNNGILVVGGNVHVYSTSFESTTGYQQFLNNGYDISVGTVGANECCNIYGCRSESMRFFNNAGSVFADLRGINGSIGSIPQWAASTHYNINDAIVNLTTGKVYAATVAGTSGLTVPSFPTDGWPSGADGLTGSTVVDGGVTWQECVYHFINNPVLAGSVDFDTCNSNAGLIEGAGSGDYRVYPNVINADFSFQNYQNSRPLLIPDFLCVDATSGTVQIFLPAIINRPGRRITIKKVDGTAHAVQIWGGSSIGQETGTQPEQIKSPYGYRTYVFGFTPAGVRTWSKVDQDDGWFYISAAYNWVNPGDKILVDTAGGPITITVFNTPQGPVPVAGQSFKVKDATASFAANNLTINANGQNINSSGSNYVNSTNGASLELVWINSTIGWKVYND